MSAAAKPYRFGVGFVCQRCGHRWPPNVLDAEGEPVEPGNCPARDCASPYWRTKKMTPKQRSDFLSKVATEAAAKRRKAKEEAMRNASRADKGAAGAGS